MATTKQPDGTFTLFVATGNTKLAWCSTEDIGGVAAQVIHQGPEKWAEKTIGVAGEHGTVAEVADTIAKVTVLPVKGVCVSPEEWKAAVMAGGLPEVAAKDLANMMAYYGSEVGMLGPRPLKPTKEAYPETQSLEAWVRKKREVFLEGMKKFFFFFWKESSVLLAILSGNLGPILQIRKTPVFLNTVSACNKASNLANGFLAVIRDYD